MENSETFPTSDQANNVAFANEWYASLSDQHGAGLRVKKARRLADLHQARKEHKGQFFTPTEIARWMWGLVTPAMDAALRTAPNGKVAILDNSIGSGRLIQFAERDKHVVGGFDIDKAMVDSLDEAMALGRVQRQLHGACMTRMRAGGFGVAVINPAFSLTLQSPSMEPFPCTTWGRFGANTSALSHAYALHQALNAAQVVVALLPLTYAMKLGEDPDASPRLRAIFRLPASAFRTEGANVATAIAVFGDKPNGRACRLEDAQVDQPPPSDLGLSCDTTATHGYWLCDAGRDALRSGIEGPVTGDTRVRVVKAGRQIALRFSCALMHAQVMNALLRKPVPKNEYHRYPADVQFTGQGVFDLEAILACPDPVGRYHQLLATIADEGGTPDPDPAIEHFLRRRHRRYTREATPFGHWVKGEGAQNGMRLRVMRKRLLVRMTVGSPILNAGEEIEARIDPSGAYLIEKNGKTATVEQSEIGKDFQVIAKAGASEAWIETHPSRTKVFPELAKSILARARATGAAGIASWDYQLEDLLELRMSRGALAAWSMGCGKGHLAIALCLMGGQHNAILVEPHLIGELVDQLTAGGIDPSMWQVIRTPEHCARLRKINIISYNRLRSPICAGAGRRTYATLLRRRLSTICADEAHLLRNELTEQTRSVQMLSPRRRYALTGTPIANYVQDILPLLTWTAGDGTVIQPYGKHHPYLREGNANSMSWVPRGVDEFARSHAVFEWVTKEFEDGLRKGAKRQVPKINNINRLRAWAAPLMKRRRSDEPMVAAHFNVPLAKVRTVELEWTQKHLDHYLTVADEFATWYRNAKRDAQTSRRSINLVSLLARIAAVERACNDPQSVTEKSLVAPMQGVTSKQQVVIDECLRLARGGHKTICYVNGPNLAEFIAARTREQGIETIVMHGKQPIKERTRVLNERFRYGPAPLVIATVGVCQTGLNLHQADRVLFAVRSWTATQEKQCMARLLRPQQTREVEATFFNLRGSIDTYQAQLTGMKQDSCDAAVDFLTPETSDDEFIHMDRIFDAFVADLAERRGLTVSEFKKQCCA